ncbi:RNA polymerase sigma factor [Chryseolinea lacunae]|uniref:RNA polymerase sigma-70 factor n=1 Tax=Chryseolinea lacunae TaxID=2801331 RepID=A0ABS1L275_9BACT|nr:RNA polymerase sigma-70 factor [Chryseolinea lacunae]MBL0745785.1 RNA polymerase sigma-70 factor [Chryseolinea lacunae]
MQVDNEWKEQDLIEALRQGDEQAYSIIFKQYWKTLYHQAYCKVQSHELAEEIVQELFLTLWEKRSTLLISNLLHYLRTALRNKCIDHIRATLVKDKYWRYYKQFIPRQADATQEMVSYNNLAEALETGLSRLPEKTKAVFALSRFEGRSIAEVAKVVRLSEKAVEYHLTKSLKILKVYLKDFVLLALLLFY